jgi:multisubunit Na+/H+ antiporter MnhE subunit
MIKQLGRLGLTLANIMRGLIVGALVCYAFYVVVLKDSAAVIIRYAGY